MTENDNGLGDLAETLLGAAALSIHPAAESFRLMTADELAALASDITENGQRDPITLARVNGAESVSLVDGRNRERACELAGVKPQYETREFADDDEVRAFVKSRGERRNVTKGQKAMAHALLFPNPEKGGRGKKKKGGETPGFSEKRLHDARRVLAFSRELALAVRDGPTSLDDALKEVESSQRAMQSAEIKLAELRDAAPDLADLATEERLSLEEALGALEKRRAQEREQREATLRVMANAVDAMAAFGSDTFVNAVANAVKNGGRAELEKRVGAPLDIATLRRGCSEFIASLEKRGQTS